MGSMTIVEAQREMRSALLGGFAGQLVSAALWLVSAALATWGEVRWAIVWLVVAGFLIFPATRVVLRLLGRPARVAPENTLWGLGAQVAMVLPLALPLVGAATLYRLDWFFPAFMIAVGAHYLPFVFLYGMRMFAALGAVLWMGGAALALWIEAPFAAGGWLTGVTLVVFGLVGRHLVLREEGAETAVRAAVA